MVNDVKKTAAAGWPVMIRFALVAAIVVGLRLPTLDQTVVDWDESVYLVVAQDLVNGGDLYRTVWDHKGPFLYAMLIPPVLIADGQLAPIRWYATLWLVATMFFLDLIGRRISSPDWSFVGALAYGLFFSLPRFGGLAANGELLMMLPATIAIWFGVRWLSSDAGRWELAGCGLFAAVAFFTKATALFTLAVIPFLVLVRASQRARPRWSAASADFAALSAPPVLVSTAILAWFWSSGRLQDYLFATLDFNLFYVAGTPFLESWERFAAFFAWASVGDPVTALALVGLIFLAFRSPPVSQQPWIRNLVLGLGLFSFIGVISARNLFFHYYLQMALPYGVVITLFTASLEIETAKWRRLASIALALGVFSAFSPHRFSPDGLTRKSTEDVVLADITAYIDQNAQVADEIYVLGGEPILYYLSQRRSPSKYFFWLYLTDRWDAILDSRKTTISEFEKAPPEWFIFTRHDLNPPDLEAFMFERYVLVREIGNYQIARLAR